MTALDHTALSPNWGGVRAGVKFRLDQATLNSRSQEKNHAVPLHLYGYSFYNLPALIPSLQTATAASTLEVVNDDRRPAGRR
jgi:hypothetical protein